MKQEQLSKIANASWLGRLLVFKPKKGEKLGIPYKPWHHIAIIDNVVLTYVWDTREVIDAYKLGDVSVEFETVKVTDNCKALFIGSDTTERAKKQVRALLEKYAELPIIDGTAKLDLKTVKQMSEDAIVDLEVDNIDLQEEAKVVFVPKDAPLPDNLYMYAEMPTVNPKKRKFADNNAYTGIGKHFAIIARCAILRDWSNLINK